MKKYFSGAWWVSFALVNGLFILFLKIYGLDLNYGKTEGTRRVLTSQVTNSKTENFYYKVNDQFALAVFTDREPGEQDVALIVYTTDYFPFCFFCGWYTSDLEDTRSILQPYRIGNKIYGISTEDSDYIGVGAGNYPVLDLDNGEFYGVSYLEKLGGDALNQKYRLTRESISKNFDEMSFAGSDDEDCWIAFGSTFAAYIILLVWLAVRIVLIIKKERKNKRKFIN